MGINHAKLSFLLLWACLIGTFACKDFEGSGTKAQSSAKSVGSGPPPAEIRGTPIAERDSNDQTRSFPYSIDTQTIRIEADEATKTLRIIAEPSTVRGDSSIVKELEATAWIVSAETISRLFVAPFRRTSFDLEAARIVTGKVNSDGSFNLPLNSTLTQQQDKSLVVTFAGIHDTTAIHLGTAANLIWSVAKFSASSLDFEILSRPSPYGPEVPSKTIRGTVWYLAADGTSCAELCTGKGSPVVPELSFADSATGKAGCEEVARAFGSIGTMMSQSGELPIGCALNSSLLRTLVSPPGTSKPEASIPGLRRMCACEP